MQVVQLTELRPHHIRVVVVTPVYAKLKRRRVDSPIPHRRPSFAYESSHAVELTLDRLQSFLIRNPDHCVEAVILNDGTWKRVCGRKQELILLQTCRGLG